jgi:hypothetical protein
VGVLADREVRPAGLVNLLHMGGDPPWRLPALHPLISRGEGKTGYGPSRRRKQEAGKRSIGSSAGHKRPRANGTMASHPPKKEPGLAAGLGIRKRY